MDEKIIVISSFLKSVWRERSRPLFNDSTSLLPSDAIQLHSSALQSKLQTAELVLGSVLGRVRNDIST